MQNLPRISVSHYRDGYNCAQSLLLAYGLESGIDLSHLVRAAEPFGVGIARLGETCGAVAGALMVIGLRYGRSEAGDTQATEIAYDLTRKFVSDFTALNGSTRCRELLGYNIGTADGMAAAEENAAFSDCPRYVHSAARIMVECLAESP